MATENVYVIWDHVKRNGVKTREVIGCPFLSHVSSCLEGHVPIKVVRSLESV
jgi:hypothetical protein